MPGLPRLSVRKRETKTRQTTRHNTRQDKTVYSARQRTCTSPGPGLSRGLSKVEFFLSLSLSFSFIYNLGWTGRCWAMLYWADSSSSSASLLCPLFLCTPRANRSNNHAIDASTDPLTNQPAQPMHPFNQPTNQTNQPSEPTKRASAGSAQNHSVVNRAGSKKQEEKR